MTLTALGAEGRHVTPNSVRIASVNEKEAGLSRARLVSAALSLVQEEGLEALSMRGLADRLNVKAARLHWASASQPRRTLTGSCSRFRTPWPAAPPTRR